MIRLQTRGWYSVYSVFLGVGRIKINFLLLVAVLYFFDHIKFTFTFYQLPIYIFLKYLFIYLWLCWVFVSVSYLYFFATIPSRLSLPRKMDFYWDRIAFLIMYKDLDKLSVALLWLFDAYLTITFVRFSLCLVCLLSTLYIIWADLEFGLV